MGALETSKTSRRSLAWAICVNVVILAAFLSFTDLRYSSNDDYTFSQAIGLNDYFFFPFSNFFLNAFIGLIQKITPFWNAWVGMQIAFSFIAFVAVCYVFFEKTKDSPWVRSLGVCIVLAFAYDHYTVFQFTQTSALLITAGAILVMHSLILASGMIPLAIGGALLCIGTWYRFSGLYVVLCFAAIFAFCFAIQNRKQILFSLQRDKKKRTQIIAVILLAIIVLITKQVSGKIDTSTAGLKAYSEYNSARSQFIDYPKPDYLANEAFFQSLGISENDYALMARGTLDPNTTATLENLRQINQLQKDERNTAAGLPSLIYVFLKDTRNSILEIDKRGVNALFLVFLAILVLLAVRFRSLPVFLLFAGAYVALHLYLYYIGRFPYRAFYCIDLAASVWCAYSIRSSDLRSFFEGRKGKGKSRLYFVAAILVSIVLVLNTYGISRISSMNEDASGLDSNKLMHHIMDNPENSFLLIDTAPYYRGQYYYSNPIKPLPENFQNNLLILYGGFRTMSPYNEQLMARNNLTNFFSDIVDNESVYIISNNPNWIRVSEQFYTDHYAPPGKTICFQEIGDIGGFNLWQVKTAPLPG